DIATSARPEEVRELFGRRRTLAIGAAFGVIGVQGSRGQPPIEVATFRSDGAYVDGRRPEGVVFTTAEEDAQRRDFTINGLFYDPLDEKLIDYVGGERDLQQGLIRAIGDPAARFSEDKLRMLRAVRFATTLGFQIEEPTLAAVRAMAREVHVVSAERIGGELRRLLVHPSRKLGVELLHETGLLEPLLPELAAQAASTWQRTLQNLDRLKTTSLAVSLAALLVEIEKPDLVGKLGRRFRFTNKEIDRATWLTRSLPLVGEAKTLPWPQLQRLLIHDGTDDLLALADAVFESDHLGIKECRRRLAQPTEKLNPPQLLSGKDLIAHGVKPGPDFALILRHIRDQQLLGQIGNRKEAEQLVAQWLSEHRST
ncbi:MAG: CCA tRNA nucleotidyltransferase, partial [Planctomycetes bacterium]|nr:CCA tRNA nucleotidyltransferase [Planctomycetota bacterium]